MSLTLHRCGSGPLASGYWIGDYPVRVSRSHSGKWTLSTRYCNSWLKRAGLTYACFPTRHEAVAAFEAALAVDPLQPEQILPEQSLKPTDTGYEMLLPDGRVVQILRHQTSPVWQVNFGRAWISFPSLWSLRARLLEYDVPF